MNISHQNKTLIVENLIKDFEPTLLQRLQGKHSFRAVNEISFSVERGEMLGFLGANGAGKTTTMQMLLGLLSPSSGSIKFNTHRIAFASGTMKLPSNLTVRQSLRMQGLLYGMPWRHISRRIDEMLAIFRITHLADKNSTRLSAGQTTTVILARTFLVEPTIVLLDEPTSTLDPENAQRIRAFISDYNQQNAVSMLFTSHNMAEVTELCHRIIVLRNGQIVANNTPEQLAATVSHVSLRLLVSQGIEQLIAHLEQNSIGYVHQDRAFVDITINEQAISSLLTYCARTGIEYSQISIDKPTLEDYFIALMRQQ